MTAYRCPVCKKPLSQREFEAALGILKAREKHHHGEMEKLRRNLEAAKQRQRAAIAQGRDEGRQEERRKAGRLTAGLQKKIGVLTERIRQLEKGSTPQTEGLEFEQELANRLRREFHEDRIEKKGQGGDVLQFVGFQRREVGQIVYECKRTARISSAHVTQAAAAKRIRDAEFAVVVTTGSRKKFGGLARQGGVLIVGPLGVLPLAGLLRAQLIEIAKAGLAKEQRSAVADRLLAYITGPRFKNPIESVAGRAGELKDMVQEEAKQHRRVWQKRWEHYERIAWDSGQIREAVEAVLGGMEPRPYLAKRVNPPELPGAPAAKAAKAAGQE